MAGECKFEKNLLEVSNCQAASTTFNTIYLWMWKEMVGGSRLTPCSSFFNVRPDWGSMPTSKQSLPKKVKATDAPTPEGEHLLRVYQRSRGHKPNDCWCSCDDVVWSGYYYYFPPLGGLLLTIAFLYTVPSGVLIYILLYYLYYR